VHNCFLYLPRHQIRGLAFHQPNHVQVKVTEPPTQGLSCIL
jgi:hypothetical protein